MQLSNLQFPKCCFFILVLLFVSNISASENSFAKDCDFNLPSARDGIFSPDGKKILFTSSRNGNNDIFIMNADGSDQKPLVEIPEGAEYYPSFSPDGKKIVFDSYYDDNATIYVVDADGTNLKMLTEKSGYNTDPDWSPDGRRIVFFSKRDGHEQIYVMNADGSGQQRLTRTDSREFTPVFSPDGKKVLFISMRDGNAQVYTMNADGSDQKRVSKSDLTDRVAHWSPDGGQIIFYSRKAGVSSKESWKSAEIEVVNLDGTGRKKLTDDKYADQGPVFSPYGKEILFTSCRSGNREVYKMNRDGSEIKRLTFSMKEDSKDSAETLKPYDNNNPSWSVDGKRIFYYSKRDGTYDIYSVSIENTSDVKKLTDSKYNNSYPVQSPDGTKITYSSKRENDVDSFVITPDGSNEIRLTDIKGDERAPKWSPDGKKNGSLQHPLRQRNCWKMSINNGQTKLIGNRRRPENRKVFGRQPKRMERFGMVTSLSSR